MDLLHRVEPSLICTSATRKGSQELAVGSPVWVGHLAALCTLGFASPVLCHNFGSSIDFIVVVICIHLQVQGNILVWRPCETRHLVPYQAAWWGGQTYWAAADAADLVQIHSWNKKSKHLVCSSSNNSHSVPRLLENQLTCLIADWIFSMLILLASFSKVSSSSCRILTRLEHSSTTTISGCVSSIVCKW